jgi:transcriptional regulator with XRE-family HTH domain
MGERLAEERARLGLTQARVAELAAVTRRTQINYERGERAPDAAYLTAIETQGFDALYVLFGRHESRGGEGGFAVAEPVSDYRVAGLKPANVRAAATAVFDAILRHAATTKSANKKADVAASLPEAARVAEAIVVLANMSESVEDVQRNAAHVVQLLK